MQICPRCGSTVEALFCGRCGMRVEAPEPDRGSVNVQQGPKGVDRSQTTVDNSTYSSSQVDDHSVRHNVYTDNSRRKVHISADDKRRVKRSQWYIGGGTLVAVVALVMFGVLELSRRPASDTVAPTTSSSAVAPVAVPVDATDRNAERRADPEARDQPAVKRLLSGSTSTEVAPVAVPGPVSPAAPASARANPADFLNRGELRPGVTAVAIVDDRRGLDPVLTQQIAAELGGTTGLFKPAFVAEGMFSRVHGGDADLLRDLGVPSSVSRLVFGLRSMSFRPVEVAGQQLVRAEAALTVRVVRPAGGFTSDLFTASATGAGFDQEAAARLATDNALQKLLPQLR